MTQPGKRVSRLRHGRSPGTPAPPHPTLPPLSRPRQGCLPRTVVRPAKASRHGRPSHHRHPHVRVHRHDESRSWEDPNYTDMARLSAISVTFAQLLPGTATSLSEKSLTRYGRPSCKNQPGTADRPPRPPSTAAPGAMAKRITNNRHDDV